MILLRFPDAADTSSSSPSSFSHRFPHTTTYHTTYNRARVHECGSQLLIPLILFPRWFVSHILRLNFICNYPLLIVINVFITVSLFLIPYLCERTTGVSHLFVFSLLFSLLLLHFSFCFTLLCLLLLPFLFFSFVN